MEEEYSELKAPSSNESGVAITFEMLQKAFSSEALERERQARECQEEMALQMRKFVWKDCLQLCNGDKAKAEQMYFNAERKAFERIHGITVEDALEQLDII